ncbi:hypothetical protein F5878DRAFT_720674 [Lentinula raphanica]|uniref:F-box domain-containing protein n=1 Tax=Lentinula raphanica TaxID=153919 RepID=A0AA38UK77_9AGAR|nr:hypothetical protein F5878DRAFT_720674 [Lentinula raphanica]
MPVITTTTSQGSPDTDPVKPQVESANLPDELPNELLAKIFHAGVDLDRDEEQPRSLITYCGVNSRWRAVCHQYPELWTDIRIPLIHCMRSQAAFERAEVWLERSKSHLIDVTITVVEAMQTMATDDDSNEAAYNTIIMLETHIPRMRRFNFWSESPSRAFSFTTISYDRLFRYYDAPQLTDLCLKFGFPPVTINDNRHVMLMTNPARAPFFKSAPQLRHQTLRGIDLQFPLTGLRSLDLFDIIPARWNLHYLSTASPSLEELRLLWLYPVRDPVIFASWPSEYPFLALRSLIVSFIPYWNNLDHSISALALMSCPNLEFLEIRGPFVPDPVTSFFDPALLTQLHTLCLRDIEFVEPSPFGVDWHALTFYLALTSVQHLQLINTPLEPLFPERLTKQKRLLRSRSLDLRGIRKGPELLELGPFSSENATSDPRVASSRTYWPKLTAITLDTTHAKDIVCLCELTAERPEIKTVYLSQFAKRLLASSVAIPRGDREDRASHQWDLSMEKESWVRRWPTTFKRDDIDPVAWLEKRVEVKEYHAKKETF